MEDEMGCDIHVYVEYSKDGKYWKNLTGNAGSRDYVMFGVLAGVRVEDARLFEPKGLPSGELSYVTNAGYWIHVAPAAHPEYAKEDGWTSRENADRWVAGGYAKYSDDKTRVSDPDSHTHSWLTTDEVGSAIRHYRTVVGKYWPPEAGTAPTEWLAIHAAMQAAEANGETARVVFWFDN
jgi:hypothetical protein